MSQSNNVVVSFLSEVKEYILVTAMVVAASLYLFHYLEEIPEHLAYVKWIICLVVFIIVAAAYFLTLRPTLQKRKELNLRPKGNPDREYFTTSPRTDDKYNFFSASYESYLEWLRHPRSPLLYLTGPSGSGKSSLINAYLAPQLQKGIVPKTSVYLLRSYHDPLKELYEAIALEHGSATAINAETVLDAVRSVSNMLSPDEQVLIVLDQFEEFFLLRNSPESLAEGEEISGVEELKTFFRLFLQAPPKGVYILLSYRDDFQQLIDKLELPARVEHLNFEQVKLLSFDQAVKFLKNCPGLEIPEQQLNRILKEATTIDSPVTLRPIVLNLFGIILQRMVSQQSLFKKENLIRHYILDSLGKGLKEERASVLKAMLTDFNTARPRALQDLSKASGLNVSQLDNQMLALQHSGLVRCLSLSEPVPGKRKWQIAHDFVALQLERVVHGVNKTVWQKTRPWIAPVLTSLLILLTSSYYGNVNEEGKKKAVAAIEKAGLTWNEQLKTIAGSVKNDSMFKVVVSACTVLKPDTLVLEFGELDDTSRRVRSLAGLDKIESLKILAKCVPFNHRTKSKRSEHELLLLQKYLSYCLQFAAVHRASSLLL